jgi:benzylsuccinate CoA-transferase BbsF subunit
MNAAGRETLPFAGLRIVEFTAAVAGPYVGKILADYGAEVIVVQAPVPRAATAGAAQPTRDDPNASHLFHKVSPNKMSFAVNLNYARGLDLVKKLIAASDAVIDNFVPRVLDKFGLTYEELKKVKSDIVMLRMPTVASAGPYKNQTSSSWNLMAMAGYNYCSGVPDDLPVCPDRYSYPDEGSSAFHAALPLLACLFKKLNTGGGESIEVSQYEGAIAFLESTIFEYMALGVVPERRGNRSRHAAPHGVYPCAGQDRWCAISVSTEEEWRSFCNILGRPDLVARPEFITLSARLEHSLELDAIIERWTADKDASALMATMQQAGIAAGAVQDVNDLLNGEPHLKEKNYWVETDHPLAGRLVGPSWGFSLSEAPSVCRRRPPVVGEHNTYVLKEILKLSDADIEALTDEGVLP